MRLSELFGRTLRQAPGVEGPASDMAERSALLRFSDSSIAHLPLGVRVREKIKRSLLSAMPAGQQVSLPPGVADTSWGDLLRAEIQSYRQLPCSLTGERALLNPDSGMKMYLPKWRQSLQWARVEASAERARAVLHEWKHVLGACFEAWGLELFDLALLNEQEAWFFAHEQGVEEAFLCRACDYRAHGAAARFQRRAADSSEDLTALEPVATPDADTIASLAAFLDIPTSKTMKAVFLKAEEIGLVFVLLRGDLDISLGKLQSLLQVEGLEPASEKDIRASGVEPGYAGPIGLRVRKSVSEEGVFVVADHSIETSVNLVTGANQPGYHIQGVNYPRDFSVTLFADIAQAYRSAPCPSCGETLEQRNGFLLGAWGRHEADVTYTSAGGVESEATVVLGTIWLDPLFAALVETRRDEQGIAWPAELAPYHVHLLEIKSPDESEALYQSLRAEGLEVLYDDRELSPGVKFTDADLIGCPIRVTVGRRSLERGGAEVSLRGGAEARIVPFEQVPGSVQTLLANIM